MLVKDVMSQDPCLVDKETSLADAVSMMVTKQRSCVIVVNEREPIGIITERDITKEYAKALSEQLVIDIKVEHVMTSDPLCVEGNDNTKDVLALSRSRRLRHLPVIDQENHVIGVVNQNSLLESYASLINHQNQLQADIEELTQLSLEDPLLKIGNRRAMEVDLAFTQAEAKRHHKSYAIALFDIDFFKKYNDRYGHQAGDRTLHQVAQAIKQSLRDSDRLFRYGGEEILALMPETKLEQALIGAERARKAVEDVGIEHLDSEVGVVTVSGGVCATNEGDWKVMVKQADESLYKAKNNGRNQIAKHSD